MGGMDMGGPGSAGGGTGMGGMDLHRMAAHLGGPDLFPAWVSVLWGVALLLVLSLHLWHVVRMGGERRWFYGGHVLMSLGMIYMFLSTPYGWTWFSPDAWIVVYCCSTAATLGWLLVRLTTLRPVNALWVLALVQQAAMVYMFSPRLVAGLSWALVGWFGVETVGWVSGALLDEARHRSAVLPFAVGPRPTFVGVSQGSGMVSVGAGPPASTVAGLECPPLLWNRLALGAMAAGMVYMFAGMQVMA